MIKALVPLDGSTTAEAALAHAVAIAHAFSAKIELINVVQGPAPNDATRMDSVDWYLRKSQGQAYLEGIASRLRKDGYSVTTTVCDGDPAKEIIQRASISEVDILVLTRFGSGNADHFSSGGTAHKVVSAATAAILLVDPRVEFDRQRGYKNVLVAVDGSQRSEWASSFAAMVAQSFDGSVELLQIVEPPHFPNGYANDAPTQRMRDHIERAARSQANFQLSHLTARIGENIEASSNIVVAPDVAMTIELTANARQTDLLVVAAQAEHAKTAGRYGPICESLLAHMRRPLLVLRSEPASASISHFQSVFLGDSHADVG